MDGLVVREYRPADSAACLALEVSGSELRFAGGLVHFAFWHFLSFNSKACQFSSHIILVCEDERSDGAICGVISVAIKRLWAHGEEVLCGYLFDLRVDAAYCKRGIGSTLTREAELRCEAADRWAGHAKARHHLRAWRCAPRV